MTDDLRIMALAFACGYALSIPIVELLQWWT